MTNQPEQISDLTLAPVAVVGEVQYIPTREVEFINLKLHSPLLWDCIYVVDVDNNLDVPLEHLYQTWMEFLFTHKD